MHISLAAEPVFFIGKFPITNSLLASWMTSLILISSAFLISKSLMKIPGRLQAFIESLIEIFLDLVESIAGERGRKFFPIVVTFFLFILISNWLGLLPGFGSIGFYKEGVHGSVFVPLLRGATADLNTTLALALVSFIAIQYFGLLTHKLSYLKRFINLSSPINLFVGILEAISEFAKIISFAFRLFGNIFAGEVLLAVIAFLIPILVPLPFYGLEIFVGLIQALVFAILTLVFINVATAHHGEEVEHGH